MKLSPPPKDPAFEAKRQEWIRCLDHKDPKTGQLDRNCVLAQVYDLVWTAGAYQVVLEARRVADKDDKGRIKLNGLTHGLLDRCFYQSQLVSIRRLMDTSPLTGNKGVFSLKSLVLDMKQNRTMFTRQNLFAAFEQAIDVEDLRTAMFDYLWERNEQGHNLSEWPIKVSPDFSDQLHRTIDQLTGVSPATRQPSDALPESVFVSLEAKLSQMATICEHVNKFLAHAATPESRVLVDADEAKITYADLWKAHELICRTCQFLDCFLLRQTSHSFLASSASDLFQYADQPLATTAQIPTLREKWTSYAKETVLWSEGSMDWLLAPAEPVALEAEGGDAPD